MDIYSQLHCLSNYSFLKGASHPHELVEKAYHLGYQAIAITDECSLSGIVKAYVSAEKYGIKLIVGSEFVLSNDIKIVALSPNKQAYKELSGYITLTRRRSDKGHYLAHIEDLPFRLKNNFIIWHIAYKKNISLSKICETKIYHEENLKKTAKTLKKQLKERIYIGINHHYNQEEQKNFFLYKKLSDEFGIPLMALNSAYMHEKSRKPLHDILYAIDNNMPLKKLGNIINSNAENYLKEIEEIKNLYSPELIFNTNTIAQQCVFCMSELRYQYPKELVPENISAIDYLKNLVKNGKEKRWPNGTPNGIQKTINKELELIEELQYEYYFLSVYDIVEFARKNNILCQGRGSAANSVVCYCLEITEISPEKINVLFERFISKERDEPPDIDVDFEHNRREEVIQYIYQKYTRHRSALAATVVTYRTRSAIRDVGKALDIDPQLINYFASSLAWWDRTEDFLKKARDVGSNHLNEHTLILFYKLVKQLLGFPRHLSQHVGGFIITNEKISDLVPVENASMPGRTVIQWDKEDIESMKLLKIDILALGMLSALHKMLDYVSSYDPTIQKISDIPKEDPATYNMLCKADSIGVFQIESRAQMSMLPRLKPRCFYDLVIEIAIVRPGPIQGDMVHPYLRRRDGIENVSYENEAIKKVLKPTLGVPIFQEQAIKLAMVAAGFSGGKADELRRAMASWGKDGRLMQFQESFIQGMLDNHYSLDFAHRLFEQIKGFGGYGFPESHSASFALLCYDSSWFKCHHPAAFYCALLNSQPMGFYSVSQLIQDAQRHNIVILPIDINQSHYENTLEKQASGEYALRLGFILIKSLDIEKAKRIAIDRNNQIFQTISDIQNRTQLTQNDLDILAAADALRSISGHRFQALWDTSGSQSNKDNLLKTSNIQNKKASHEQLWTNPPTLERDIILDQKTTGMSLRPHIMSLLRVEPPFSKCTRQQDLSRMNTGRFVQVAGLVTGRQRPGTAKGSVFLTLEDETGNINIIVWKNVQNNFRSALLTSTLLLVKGRLETKNSVVHIIAGQLVDCTERLNEFELKSRDFH